MLLFNFRRSPRLHRLLVAALTVAALGLVGFIVIRLSPPKLADLRIELPEPMLSSPSGVGTAGTHQTAVFAGGCFWGMEALFEHVHGVSQVVSGYAGGTAETATYKQVSAGKTGHAESIEITYDPAQVSYGELLKIFFTVAHDPTQLNQQGFDVGPQYRSAIFVTNPEQEKIAQAYIDQLNQAEVFYQPVVTEVQPLEKFYAAEDYHQDFVAHHPTNFYVMAVEIPKIDRFQKRFPDLYAASEPKS